MAFVLSSYSSSASACLLLLRCYWASSSPLRFTTASTSASTAFATVPPVGFVARRYLLSYGSPRHRPSAFLRLSDVDDRSWLPRSDVSGGLSSSIGSSGSARFFSSADEDCQRLDERGRDLESFTVVQLRAELRGRGLKVSGRKAELIDRLSEHFRSPKIDDDAIAMPPRRSARTKAAVANSTTRSDGRDHARDDDGASKRANVEENGGGCGSTEAISSPPQKKPRALASNHQRWTERVSLTKLWDRARAFETDGSYTFTVISWNVNGLRALLKNHPTALSDLAEKYRPDVICLQETKLQECHVDDPKLKIGGHLLNEGYDAHYSCSTAKKGYSGTATFVKRISEGKDGDDGAGGGSVEAGLKKGGKKQAKLGAFFQKGGKNEDGMTAATTNASSSLTPPADEKPTGDPLPSRLRPLSVVRRLGNEAHDSEGRVIVAEFPHFYLTNLYVPNSGQKLERLGYRTGSWDVDLLSHQRNLEKEKPVIWLGDLNVAYDEKDVWNEGAKHLAKNAGTTVEERMSFGRQIGAGYVDAFRRLHPDGRGQYTYWSQRAGNREPNKGLRLDYFICSESLFVDEKEGSEERNVIVRDSFMIPEQLGSDHCPIVLEIEIKK